jgi:hypothetical protein
MAKGISASLPPMGKDMEWNQWNESLVRFWPISKIPGRTSRLTGVCDLATLLQQSGQYKILNHFKLSFVLFAGRN